MIKYIELRSLPDTADPVALKRALFVVLEGIDGSGTTTQAHRIAERMMPAIVTAEPSTGPVGLEIRDRLAGSSYRDRHALALLFAADRLDHLATVIKPALTCGTNVICDRYVMSSYAYQSLDCDPEWVQMLNGHAVLPDITFFVDVPVELAQQRIAARAVREKTPEQIFDAQKLQERVAKQYRAYIAGMETASSYPSTSPICLVDGAQEPEVITAQILAMINDHVDSKR